MKRHSYLITAICFLLLLGATAQAQFLPQPFSADFSAVTKNHTGDAAGKLFFAMPNTRMDMSARGHATSMIMIGSTKTSYMVMHDQHMYMEMKADQPNPIALNLLQVGKSFDPKNPCSFNAETTCKDLGADTVNGRSCEKWLVTQKDGHATTMWIDHKLHFPIRSETSDGRTFEFTNIKEGPQPASLFEPPAGYRKVDLGSMRGGAKGPQ